MVVEFIWYGFALLVTITVIAAGAYVGALRAMDTFYSGEDSMFLSDDVPRGRE
jgi:hypothetical protein